MDISGQINRTVVLMVFLTCMLISCEKSAENNIIPDDPTGELLKYGICKEFAKSGNYILYGSDTDCIEYYYNEDSTLEITHINAGFNCCPEKIVADFIFRNDSIIITENEINGFCDCNCLYDLDYKLSDISPGKYIISVNELLTTWPEAVKLEFEINLSEYKNGLFCVTRTRYPWGDY